MQQPTTARRPQPRPIWFGRLHTSTWFSVHPVTWQGWLLTALMVMAEVATALSPGLAVADRWIVRGAILALFLVVAFSTRDPNRNP